MKTVRSSILLLLVAFAFTLMPAMQDAPVNAAGKRDKLQSTLTKEDAKVRKKVAKSVEKYAGWCADCGAYSEARSYLNALALLSGGEFGGKVFDRVRDKEDEVRDAYEKGHAAERAKLLNAGAELLGFVVDAWKKQGEDFAAETAALWLRYFRDDALLKKHGWVWNAKQGCLMPSEASERVDGGELRYAGEWLDAAAIAEHNGKHATFKNPTVLTDGRLILYSELPLELNLRLMNVATRYRVFLLDKVGGQMDMRHAGEALKMYMAKDRASYNAQGKKITDSQGVNWHNTFDSGKYLGVVGLKGGPIIMSPDVPTSETESIPCNEVMLINLMQHELTHMLCTENLKHLESGRWTKSPSGPPPHNKWAYEGIATWSENFFWSDEQLEFEWVLRRKFTLNAEKGKAYEARLGRAVARLDQLPSTDTFVVQTDSEFANGQLDAYAQSCAIWTYLYSQDAGTRAKLMKFARVVHCKESDKGTFTEVFKGTDAAKLDADIRTWLKGLEFAD